MLFLEGEIAAGVYVLHSGEVDLLFSAKNGRVRALRIATPGQILGLSSVVTGRPHDCSATTRVACEIGFIPSEQFLHCVDEYPALWFCVLRVLSSEVNAAYDDMRTLAMT